MTKIQIPADRAKGHGGEVFTQVGDKFAETFEMWGGLSGKDRVLDIGCGPGRMAISIGERYGWTNNLTGFDVIKIDTDVCRDLITSVHPNFEFHHLNAWNGFYNPEGTVLPDQVTFPAADGSIDFAFATSVFTHMFRKEVERYLSEAYRSLDKDGRLLSTWFAITDDAFAATRSGTSRFKFANERPDGSFFEKPEKPEFAVGYRERDIVGLLEAAGFKEIKFYEGAWSKTTPGAVKFDANGVTNANAGEYVARHGQDLFVCRK